MIWTLFFNWRLANLRVFAIIVHLIMQIALIWTKFDCIQVAMVNVNDDAEYITANNSYMTLLGFGIAFVLFKLACFLSSNLAVVTLASVMHLALDLVGIFFSMWIILDGLAWTTYSLVWLFCLLFPAIYDLGNLCVNAFSKLWIRRNTIGYMQRLYTWYYGKKIELQD